MIARLITEPGLLLTIREQEFKKFTFQLGADDPPLLHRPAVAAEHSFVLDGTASKIRNDLSFRIPERLDIYHACFEWG